MIRYTPGCTCVKLEGQSSVTTVCLEMYHFRVCRFDCTDMTIYRSALNACVVSGLPNVRDYIHKERNKNKDDKKTRS